MLIHQVALVNFKSYAKATVELAPGTVAIVGANGAGKSSLLDAIGLVLFDCQRGTYAERLREGERKGSIRVRVSSSLDERTYDVIREFSDRTTLRYVVADLELDGRVLAEGSEQVTAWLREHLRVEPSPGLAELFRATIGVEQGTFTAPFLLSAASRKAQFDPLLQVDAYRAAYDALRPTVRHLNETQQEIARDIAHLQGQLEELPRQQERLRGVRERLAALVTEIAQDERAIASNQPQLAQLQARQLATQEARDLASRAESELEQQEQRLAQARAAVERAQAAQQVLRQSEPGYEAYQAAHKRLDNLDEQRGARDRLQREAARHDTEAARLLERIKAAQALVDRGAEARAQIRTLQPRVDEQERLERSLQQAEERHRDGTTLERRIADLERQVAGEATALADLQSEVARVAQLAEERDQVQAALQSLAEQKETCIAEIAHHRARLQQIADQTSALQQATAACPTCEQPLPDSRRDELLGRNQADRDRLQRDLTATSRRVNDIDRRMRANSQRLGEIETAQREGPSSRELSAAEARHSQAITGLEEARDQRRAMGDTAADVANARSALGQLGDPRSEQRAAGRAAKDAAEAEGALATAQASLSKTLEQRRAIESLLARYQDLDSAIAQTRAERDRHRPAYEAYLRAQEVAHTLPQAQGNLAEAQKGISKATTLRDQAVQAATEASAAYDADAHRRVLQELERADRALVAARTQTESLEEQSRDLSATIGALERLRGEMAAQQEALAESRATSDLLAFLRDLLRDAGPLVTQRLIRRISQQAAQFYAELMGQPDGSLVWGEDYALYLDVGGERRGFEQLSGGERMAAALAVRMALLRETSAVDVAFFDEPTAHLDSERRESLAERLMALRGFSQLFVISHDDTFEQAAQSYVRIWRDADGSHALS